MYFVSQKKVFCFGNHNETEFIMESSKVPGNKESVYDKFVKEFRELEKNADKYFDNLDAVEEMCYKVKKDAQRFRLKAEADKELLKRDAAVRAKLFSSVLAMKLRPIKEEPNFLRTPLRE